MNKLIGASDARFRGWTVLLALALLLAPVRLVAARITDSASDCRTLIEWLDLGSSLPKTRAAVANRKPIRIVTIGSSSTAGFGASRPSRSYPRRLAEHLGTLLPGNQIVVLNRGVNGEDAPAMIARFERDVLAWGPQLVLWQVGTNSIVRGHDVERLRDVIRGGVSRLKSAGGDIVLIDLQFAPRVVERPEHRAMLSLIQDIARSEGIGLLRRHEIMRQWQETGALSENQMIARDGLHMTDASYDCFARAAARAIARAVGVPT